MFLSQLDLSLGAMQLVTDKQQVVRAFYFAVHKERLHCSLREYYGAVVLVETSTLTESADALVRYFDSELEALNALRTKTAGPEQQRRVWASLSPIPECTITTYDKLGRELGFDDPRAAIDMGVANGSNFIAIIVPCHRVIASNGYLKDYVRGVHRKRLLLEHEMVMTSKDEKPQTTMLPGF